MFLLEQTNRRLALLKPNFANKPLFIPAVLTPSNTKCSLFSVDTKKPDNAGGIAASVIVVLLLIATLIALLVYYLRTRQGADAGPSPSQPLPDTAGFSSEIYEPEPAVSSSDSQAFDNKHIYPYKIPWIQ